MTTENLAVLFTDVVGSTELSQRISTSAADEVRRRHFSLLRQAVAETSGTEVKNLGDGIMVVFGSAPAALGCAVAMQQSVELNNRGEETVGLRIGLSGGEVVAEDDDFFGDPVVEGARLCAKCESGQVLASKWLLLTAGRRNRHACRPLGDLALKGLSGPVETVEVLWEPLGGAETATIPLPARLAVRPGGPCGWPRIGDDDHYRRREACNRRRRSRDPPRFQAKPARARQPWQPRRPVQRSTPGRASCSGTAKRTSPRRISSLPRRSAAPPSRGSAGGLTDRTPRRTGGGVGSTLVQRRAIQGPEQSDQPLQNGRRPSAGRISPRRCPRLLRPSPGPAVAARRPRSGPGARPGHWPRHSPTSDRGPVLPPEPPRCGPPGHCRRRHRAVGGRGLSQQQGNAQLWKRRRCRKGRGA